MSIASALEVYAEAPRAARRYRLGEVAVILGTFAAAMVALDSEGLVTWAKRMEVGPVQSAWLSVLTRLHEADGIAGLTAPREGMLAASDWLSAALGAGEDPLFVEAWRSEAIQPAMDLSGAGGAELLPVANIDESDPELESADAVTPTGQTTVLLVGDSLMAGSMGAAIARAAAKNPRLRVVQAVQSATGLSRPDVFDWAALTPLLVEREKPQLVVASFGANDAQGIRDGDRLLEFGEAAWRAAYRQRVLATMRALTKDKTRVLWLGLPPMRDGKFSDRVSKVNQVFAQVAKKVPRVEYLELNMLIAGPDGGYATFITDEKGRYLRVRMDDGVHYSPGGAGKIARWIFDWMVERLPRRADKH